MEDIKIAKITPMNIIFPLRGDEVLLGIKTMKIGIGKYNGYGGKQEVNETMPEACSRELRTESGLVARPSDFEKVAVVDFFIHKNDGSINLNKCDIFTVRNFVGEPKESKEMIRPRWFNITKLPLSDMMIDASFWIPRILSGEKIKVQIHYNEDRTNILNTIHSERLT